MARLNGRTPVEIKLPDLLNQSLPIYDLEDRLWSTINVGDVVSGSAALSGSNIFHGDQIITGSLFVSGSATIVGDLTVTGTTYHNFITASTLLLNDNWVTVTTTSSLDRFAGLRVLDYEVPGDTASFAWDTTANRWIEIVPDHDTYTSSLFIMGPRNSGSIGDEVGLTTNRLTKGDDSHHIVDSNISDNGTIVSINSNTQITGSLDVSQSITGSLITGAFIGDGSQLTNIPLSGVTGADASRIVDGNATASISDTQGLRINTNTEITGSLIVSSGSAVFDASLQLTENSSLILNSGSNLYVYDNGIISGTFKGNGALLTDLPYATTGSNTFYNNQTISGSVIITQDLTVLGSSSIVYVTSSQLDIATNIIKVNAANPGVRYGGLEVVDSGSNPQVSGSFLFDSQKDEWIFIHQSQGVITSSVFLLGPETFDDLGNETYLTQNRIPKGTGIEHLNDSNITDTGTVVSINSNTEITGGLKISGSINIGQFYTVPQVLTGAIDITGSLTLNGSQVGTGKLDENQFNQFTASYKTGSFTGSFIGDGSGLYNLPISGITGLNLNDITGSLNVSGSVTASFFVGDGSQLTNLPAAANVLRISGSAGDNTIVDLLSSSLYITGSGLVTASLSNGGITINVPYVLNQYDGITKKHTQSSPSTTWTFVHNLGERYPAIQVFDSNGYVVVPSYIHSVDTTTLVVYFSSAQSGTVTATVGGGLPAISASYNGYTLRTDGVTAQWQSMGDLPFAITGSNSFVGDQTITGSVKIKNAKMDATCSVMSTSGTVISATGYDGANFDYVVKSGSNMRFGNIMAVWSGASVKYSETSTTDLGNTSGVTFTVSNTGDLNAVIASGTWTIEVMYRALGCISGGGIGLTPTPTSTSNNTPTPTRTPTPTPTPTSNSYQLNVYSGVTSDEACGLLYPAVVYSSYPTLTDTLANGGILYQNSLLSVVANPSHLFADGTGLNFILDSTSQVIDNPICSVSSTPTRTPTPTPTPTPTRTTYTVGQAALGGVIAYVLQSGDPGYDANVQHGLIATSSDISSSAQWGCESTRLTGALGSAIGTGNQNTIDIITECTTSGIAAKLCADLTTGGYSDWYLPSKNELNKLYENRVAIGGFVTNGGYWSSTQFEFEANNHAYYQLFSSSLIQNGTNKNAQYNVRAVRSF